MFREVVLQAEHVLQVDGRDLGDRLAHLVSRVRDRVRALLDHRYPGGRTLVAELEGRGQPRKAASENRYIEVVASRHPRCLLRAPELPEGRHSEIIRSRTRHGRR